MAVGRLITSWVFLVGAIGGCSTEPSTGGALGGPVEIHNGVAPDRGGAAPVVGDVAAASPAEQAGVRVGDLITHLDGDEVETWSGFVSLVQLHEPDDVVHLTIQRGSEQLDLPVVLGTLQTPSGPRPRLGISVASATAPRPGG